MSYRVSREHYDFLGRRDCPTGPAMVMQDGSDQWWRKGVMVPAVIVSDDTVKFQTVDVSQFPSAVLLDDSYYQLDHTDMNLIRLVDGVMVVYE